MKLDDEVCLCFHVTRRKVTQFIRVNRPEVPSQLSECFGAGTGCGWCRPFLEKIFEQQKHDAVNTPTDSASGEQDDLPDATQYASSRAVYRAAKKSSLGDP
jgi:bacterioferritin-associated ferredoxin